MLDPIALALLSLPIGLGMHLGAGCCQRLSGKPQVRGRGPMCPPVPWLCLHRWKRACTCSSQAPTAVARVLCSGSLAGSGPHTAACSTSPRPSACSTSLRGEQHRDRVGATVPAPSDLWKLTPRRWQSLGPWERDSKMLPPASWDLHLSPPTPQPDDFIAVWCAHWGPCICVCV